MGEPTMIKMSIDIERQKMMNAFILHQEEIAESVTRGVDAAVKTFDFEAAVKHETERLIKQEVSDTIWRGELRKLIQTKMNAIVEKIIEKEMKLYEQ